MADTIVRCSVQKRACKKLAEMFLLINVDVSRSRVLLVYGLCTLQLRRTERNLLPNLLSSINVANEGSEGKSGEIIVLSGSGSVENEI